MSNESFVTALWAVYRERLNQEAKHPGDTPANPDMSDERRLVLLVEEVGEVARAMQDGQPADVLSEVRQVAALAFAWMETSYT